jgi:hypothetical protein
MGFSWAGYAPRYFPHSLSKKKEKKKKRNLRERLHLHETKRNETREVCSCTTRVHPDPCACAANTARAYVIPLHNRPPQRTNQTNDSQQQVVANLTAKQGPNPTAMPLASQVLPPHRQYLKPASRSLLQKKQQASSPAKHPAMNPEKVDARSQSLRQCQKGSSQKALFLRRASCCL